MFRGGRNVQRRKELCVRLWLCETKFRECAFPNRVWERGEFEFGDEVFEELAVGH